MTPEEAAERGVQRAQAALELGRHDEALRHAREALAAAPGTLDAHGLIARAHLGKHQYEEAVRAVEEGLANAPDSEWFHRIRALALHNLERNSEALASADEALRLDPDSASAHYLRSKILQDMTLIDEAKAAIGRALELDPDSASYHFQLGNLLLPGDPKAAEAEFRTSLSLDPTDADTLNNLGVALRRQKRELEAAAAFKSAVLVDPTMEIAKENARATVKTYLRAGLSFGVIFFLGARTLIRALRDQGGVGVYLAGFGVVLLAGYLGVWWYRRRDRLRKLQQVDPQLFSIYQQLERDKAHKRTAA